MNYSSLGQYIAGIRTSVVRMHLKGMPYDDILFDFPGTENFEKFSSNQVFHQKGGGNVYVPYPKSSCLRDPQYEINDKSHWVFSKNYNLVNVESVQLPYLPNLPKNTDQPDFIGILPNINFFVCNAVARHMSFPERPIPKGFWQKLGIKKVAPNYIPEVDVVPNFSLMNEERDQVIDLNLLGKEFGCFEAPDQKYYYFHVVAFR